MNDNLYLKTEGLSVNYGSINALSEINLEIFSGNFLAVTGPNGGGKSSLIRAVLSLIPYSGKVYLKPHLKVSYVPQHSEIDKTFPITALEAALCGRQPARLIPFHKFSKTDRAIAENSLERAGLGGFENRSVSSLSGGEFQKLLIARALAAQPDLLFLDEPTANVDAKSRGDIYPLLKRLSQNTAVVLVTHNFDEVKDLVTSAVYLDRRLEAVRL